MFKLSGNALPRISLLLATFSLAACGGGGSSDGGSDPAPDGGSGSGTEATAVEPGIFETTVTPGSGAPDQVARTLLSSSGEYAIFTNALSGTFGTLTFHSDDTFSGNGKNVFFDETWQSNDGSLEGSSISSEEITATFTADSSEPDNYSDIIGIRANGLSDLKVTMQDLYETFSLYDEDGETVTASVTINTSGTVNGSTADGCAISGDISIPDPAYNLFEGDLLFENCNDVDGVSSDQRDGNYRIIGYLLPRGDGIKRLVFAGTNGEVMSLFSGTN